MTRRIRCGTGVSPVKHWNGAAAVSREPLKELTDPTLVAVCVAGDVWPRGLLSENPIPDNWMGLVIKPDGRRRYVPAGENPRAEPWLQSGGDPLSRLLTLQLPGGGFEPQPGTSADVSTTAQAMLALLGETQPLRVDQSRIFLPMTLLSATVP